jgi:hypothetical protein
LIWINVLPAPFLHGACLSCRRQPGEFNAKSKRDGNSSFEDAAKYAATPESEAIEPDTEDQSDAVATIATVAVVGVGAAVFEAALLPGIVLGVAAVQYPGIFRK